MTHDDAMALIAILKSLDGWMWWLCFWIFINGAMS